MSQVKEILEMKDGNLRKIIEIPGGGSVMCNNCQTFAGITEWDEVLEDGSVIHYWMCNNCGKIPHPMPGHEEDISYTVKPTYPKFDRWECRSCFERRWTGLHWYNHGRKCCVYKTPEIQNENKAKQFLLERCSNKGKFKLIPVFSPKVPVHSHYPYEKMHPVSRKHRDNTIIVRKYVSPLGKRQ